MKVKGLVKGFTGNLSKGSARVLLKCKQYSPELLIVGGIALIVGGTVAACKATRKVDPILDDNEYKVEKLKETKDENEEYKKDLTLTYAKTGLELTKLYAPSAIMLSTGVGCILASHGIMRKRYIGVVSAYNMLDQTFKTYRDRVKEELGEDADQYFKNGVKKEKLELSMDDGKGHTKIKKVEENTFDPNDLSVYARIYDESCKSWSKNPEYNLVFLRGQQNYFNDLLKVRGHVFLNDVYDALGIPRSSAGSVVGWVIGEGDNYVDFGIYNMANRGSRDFVNGYERSIWLDFNVDGVIYDKI